MKILIIALLILITCSCSTVLSKSDQAIYSLALEKFQQNNNYYPKQFVIAPIFLYRGLPHLESYDTDSLQSFMKNNGWSYVYQEHSSSTNGSTIVYTKEVLPLKNVHPTFDVDENLYVYSPVIYSEDKKKRFLYFQINNSDDVLFGMVFILFEKKDGKWNLVKESIPPLY